MSPALRTASGIEAWDYLVDRLDYRDACRRRSEGNRASLEPDFAEATFERACCTPT